MLRTTHDELENTMGLRKIGRGRFSDVYRQDTTGHVIIFSRVGDLSKLIVSKMELPNLPDLLYLGPCVYNNEPRRMFVSHYYAEVNRCFDAAFRIARTWQMFLREYDNFEQRRDYVDGLLDFMFDNLPDLSPLLKIVEALWNSLEDQDQYCLEFPLNNLAEDIDGNLIFLDILF